MQYIEKTSVTKYLRNYNMQTSALCTIIHITYIIITMPLNILGLVTVCITIKYLLLFLIDAALFLQDNRCNLLLLDQ